MIEKLRFDDTVYEIKNCEICGRSITFRAYEGIDYCLNPLDSIQKLNLYVPEIFYRGGVINGYDLKTAPIFAPNTVGGYMPGPVDEPGVNLRTGEPNTIFQALEHGYVVVSPGLRGRTSGMKSQEFFVGAKDIENDFEESAGNARRMVGRAPAFIVDMKAVIRYLRYNKDYIPGDVEKMITNGTSAGGALSALTGATGNSSDYEPYLEAIGAVKERDDIFAASCYCPIHNLENADTAYEWLFSGDNEYHKLSFKRIDGEIASVIETGILTEEEQRYSRELKKLFPAYVNRLDLKDDKGNSLFLDDNGEGSFKDWVREHVRRAAQKEWETHDSGARLEKMAVVGSEIEDQDYLIIQDGKVVDLDFDAFVKKITRMKKAPAFDAVDLNSPECEEFGTEEVYARHFTKYAYENSQVKGTLADEKLIRMMNPITYIGKADTAKYWRIRHGAFDRDTSLAIPVILATILNNKGYEVDFALPWGLPHSGDYDIKELFDWIDRICKGE